MRIFGSNAIARATAAPAPKRAANGGFALSEDQAPATTGPVATLRTVGGIDALMALQGQDDRPERRRRAVTQGRTALDALDALKVDLLAGTLETATVNRMKSAGANLAETSGDAALDAVIAEIDLRLAVEIAKLTAPQNGG
ncbi:MAG: flagellar assembly protein FliX [Deltaproteobacteria bacterium]|nr:flagellar assembly protein FliX [Deltaproteobacteria bacterium]